ncbi:MAG TPA: hypothetical protein VFH23_16345 [Jiangellaceae bacterium]|nr:hypothetical protein [Jiangellaceae bacterium]
MSRSCGGLTGFAAVAAFAVLEALGEPGGALVSLLLCLAGFGFGVLARDNYLSTQVTNRERRILKEFPAIAELLALSVAAGESPVAALDRVVARSGGELSRDLAKVPRGSRSQSSAAPRSPTCCTPKRPTYARPAATSSSRPRPARKS